MVVDTQFCGSCRPVRASFSFVSLLSAPAQRTNWVLSPWAEGTQTYSGLLGARGAGALGLLRGCRDQMTLSDQHKDRSKDSHKQADGGAGASAGKDAHGGKRRAVRRCALVASAEVSEPKTGALLKARTSEIGVGGCYIDTLNPFPQETLVQVRILRDSGAFEAKARVVYSDTRFGMGLAFTEMTAEQRLLLENWLAELVTQLVKQHGPTS
jgi:hypothetical protein